jgi:RNA polymerase sigma factor (sigma-70 family)
VTRCKPCDSGVQPAIRHIPLICKSTWTGSIVTVWFFPEIKQKPRTWYRKPVSARFVRWRGCGDSNVKSWLFTILRNTWLNQLRQRKTVPDIVELDSDEHGANRAVDSSKDPHAAYVSDLEREQVRHAIEQLPLESREVILLREYEELSYEEIAAMLQCPVGTVMSRLARARSKLRDQLVAIATAPSGTKGANDTKDTQREIGLSG